MGSKSNLTLVMSAVDNASPSIKQLTDTVRHLPRELEHAHGALRALGGAAEQMGGPVAEAASKLTGLANLVANGGPVGIGIAALTAAVGVGAIAWKAHTAAATYAEEQGGKLETILRKQSGALTDLQTDIEKTSAALEDFGKSSEAAKSDNLQKSIEDKIRVAADYRDHIEKLQQKVAYLTSTEGIWKTTGSALAAARGELNDEMKAEVIITEGFIRLAQSHLDGMQQEIKDSEELIGTTNELATKKDLAADAAKRKAAAERAEKEDLAQLNAMIKEAIDKETEYGKKVGEILAKAGGQWAAYYNRIADLSEKQGHAVDKANEEAVAAEKKAADERAAIAQSVAGTITSSFVSAYDMVGRSNEQVAQIQSETRQQIAAINASVKDGTITAEEGQKRLARVTVDSQNRIRAATVTTGDAFAAVGNGLVKMILQQAATYAIAKGIEAAADRATSTGEITTAASVGGAKAISAYAGIPVVGIGLGLAAAATVIALILAMKNFAKGGLVTGGIAGRDSVPAMLMPGEMVLPVSLTNQLRATASAAGSASPSGMAFASGGVVHGGSFQSPRGNGPTVIITQNNRLAPDRLQNKRLIRDMERELRDAVRRFGRA